MIHFQVVFSDGGGEWVDYCNLHIRFSTFFLMQYTNFLLTIAFRFNSTID